MADKNKFEEMLERLVNEDKAGAEELFHDIVVEKSRDIYENLADEEVTAEAKITESNGKKIIVNVIVSNKMNESVFEGDFVCFVLDKHLLSK